MPHLPHGKVDNAAFIHGNLDDLGLRPHPFRVYCHVARRGNCFASVATIAKTCRMNPDTVRKALKGLVNVGLLTAQYRKGETTLYAVNHSKIISGPLPKGGSTPSEKNGVPPSTNKVGHPYEKRGGKVYPTKDIPLSKENHRNNKMSSSVMIIELSKAIAASEKACEEFKGRHRGEVAGGDYHWDLGTREHYLEIPASRDRCVHADHLGGPDFPDRRERWHELGALP